METVKWYTRARRIPTLFGKMPNGGKIWGGPYTSTQVAIGAAVGFVLWKTAGLWGTFGVIGNLIVAAGLVYGAVIVAGRIPTVGRNPFAFALSAASLVVAPNRLKGMKVAVRRPRMLAGNRTLVEVPGALSEKSDAAAAPAPAPTASPARPRSTTPDSAARVRPAPALTGVQRLLADAIIDTRGH